MLNFLAAFSLAFSFSANADFQCMGFEPEAAVICNDGGELHKVHAFEEERCAAGRDGVLNDSIPILQVEGPTWTDHEELAHVSFKTTQGDPVTLKNCTLLALE